MNVKDIIERKKQWRAHAARVKVLPTDQRISGRFSGGRGPG
ncbi:hypothetical protein [Streptomyces sp. NPDC088254]